MKTDRELWRIYFDIFRCDGSTKADALRAVYDAGRADAEQWERRLRAVLSRDPGGEIAFRFGAAGAETDDEVIAAIDAAIEGERAAMPAEDGQA